MYPALSPALFLVVLTALAVPLGAAIARVAEAPAPRAFARLERALGAGAPGMRWRELASALVALHVVGVVVLYVLLRVQHLLPLNPLGLPAVEPGVALNTAVSFVTNTNWQAYGGESTLSFASQMVGLTTQNFLSAAIGIAVLFALARAFVAHNDEHALGNAWVDIVRVTGAVLLPLSLVTALVLVQQGVPQTFAPKLTATTLEGEAQEIALGPVASQVAIKQLGTNGGGFFNVNSAHPLENPTPLSNAVELLSILLLPAALCFAFGALVRDRRHGRALYAAMMVLFVAAVSVCVWAEVAGNPLLAALGVDDSAGNLEGKEVRFGAVTSAMWATATTAASNGSVNAMHDSFTPIGGLVPLVLMQIGEVVFGGVGSGLYGMVLYAIVAVFLAGLMVGRTPELLGKKLGAAEIKMATLGILLPSAATLLGTAVACALPEGHTTLNPSAHGFSEILYAFSSGANNNGSAFGGLTVNGPFYTVSIALCMWVGRLAPLVCTLAIAGALASKKKTPPSASTFPAHGPLFVTLLAGVVVLVGVLTFVPALALGPVAEHLQLKSALSASAANAARTVQP